MALMNVMVEHGPEAAFVALGAYTFGCFTTGYYLARARTGRDLRQEGTGSLGARNAGRILGKQGFLLTVMGDLFKGVAAVFMAQTVGPDSRFAGLALVAVVAGHLWPVQLGLRGGKGVATMLGALLMFQPSLAFAWAGVFAAAWLIMRRSTLPAMLGFALLPFVWTWLASRGEPRDGRSTFLAITACSAMVLWAHRRNLSAEFGDILDRKSFFTSTKP